MIDFFIRSNWGRVVREDWRFRERFRRKKNFREESNKTRKKSKAKKEKEKEKEKNKAKRGKTRQKFLTEKVSNHQTKQQQNSVVILTIRILKNNGRELCKDGSAFRSRGRWRRIVAPSTGGESGNDGTYKKKRERELDFFDHLISSEIIIHSLCFYTCVSFSASF